VVGILIVVFTNGAETVIPAPAAEQCGEGDEPAAIVSHLSGDGAAGSRLTFTVRIREREMAENPLQTQTIDRTAAVVRGVVGAVPVVGPLIAEVSLSNSPSPA
jgi:hypothetical protein